MPDDEGQPTTYISFGPATPTRGKLFIATRDTPDSACGKAHRIGYTDAQQDAYALYRLKVKSPSHDRTLTLPNLFVLDNGIFHDYDKWQQAKRV